MPETRNRQSVERDIIVTIVLTVVCQIFRPSLWAESPLLLPIIRKDLGLSFTQGGVWRRQRPLVYALMQMPAGYLSDRFSPKKLFSIGISRVTLLALTFGASSPITGRLVKPDVVRIFRSLSLPRWMALLTGWFPPNRRATRSVVLSGVYFGQHHLHLVGHLLVARFDWRFPLSVSASRGNHSISSSSGC